ncbi:homeobox protein Nkx-6.1-like [Phyllostomus hastatus]|uniref:homeobox protein Nkx-6.1-like n=1 Tax=Phyllostomus hastatus TaxID=9423 RepID=UPI001E681810|nr:homeobox protein Nkx-6.1-like [Phyllostomus hastatus]
MPGTDGRRPRGPSGEPLSRTRQVAGSSGRFDRPRTGSRTQPSASIVGSPRHFTSSLATTAAAAAAAAAVAAASTARTPHRANLESSPLPPGLGAPTPAPSVFGPSEQAVCRNQLLRAPGLPGTHLLITFLSGSTAFSLHPTCPLKLPYSRLTLGGLRNTLTYLHGNCLLQESKERFPVVVTL